MCSVVGCDSSRRSAQRFKLPEDPERRLEWVQFLFEVNGQRLKESCWTDITICSEHFTGDCFRNLGATGTAQLKHGVVPSLCIKSEPDELESDPESPKYEEPVGTPQVDSHCEQLKACDSPSSYSEGSGLASVAVPVSPVPSDTSDVFMSDHGHILQKIVNIDMIREKAALLQMKGKYVVNEKRLLQLLSTKCPLCGSKVKVQKIIHGILIVLNQQCLQCEYRNQWKSQVNATVPPAVYQDPTGGTEVTPETASEESDPMNETEESSDQGDMDSDDDWKPVRDLLPSGVLHNESDEETDDEDDEVDENDIYPPLAPKHSQLCTECGRFYSKRWPHTCEHKVKPYSCNICGKRCVSEVALNSHSRVHNENYEHPCKYCNITFKTKVDKITHQQIHLTQGKPYKCPDCSETFATNKERRTHLEDHRGPQELKCHICGIEFNRLLSIRRHLIVHTGLKPYKCSVCQRGFNQAGHLKSHMRLHTGERPFKCQHCDKRFNHNVSLKSHVQRYHASGCEQKKGKINKTVSDTGDAQGDGNKRGADSELDNVEGEEDAEEEVPRPKRNRRSTGRPIGRPKRNAAGNFVLAGEMQDPGSNTKTRKSKQQRLRRTQCNDEESEDDPSESDMSFDSKEEEEEKTEKVTNNKSKSRKKPNNSDSDIDFDAEHAKRKRYSSRNSGKSTRKRRGRPRKVVEDT
ncbi:zinc finger protein 236-like [Seriola lalandi dorsalis]|uniref:zinc finger protein 236-like n=1 Tax=Seriola lalandi dorsalis TaxID=1841481 RepID=UPI000C6FA774|nr:zinc finger protein 236-like [Seriola lalandi dorsalis]